MDKVGHPRIRGTALVSAITSVCSFGFWLFGYDQGVMSGVVVSRPWLTQMGNPSTVMIGTITSLYDIGAIVGAVAAASNSERLGRKRTLILGAIILIIGSALMGSAFERIQMMVARVIAGIGIGYITSVAPVYQSEITLPEHRGWLVCCQSTGMLGGLMLGYWINYGFYFHSSSVQWRFPLLFQCIFAIYVIAVTLWLPETPRWLMQHDPTPDRGTTVLAKLRGVSSDHPAVQHERAEIPDAISLEAKEKGSWSDLFKDHGIQGNKRFYLAVSIQFLQELSGINIVTYYASTLFQESLGMSQERSLFLGCFLQVWYIIASFVTWYTIDRLGRRKLWISMACGQCLVLVLEAVCVKMNTSRASIGAVFLIFVYESCFTWGWMATVWIYPPEILPLKLRAKGSALATAADFLGNFVVRVTCIRFLDGKDRWLIQAHVFITSSKSHRPRYATLDTRHTSSSRSSTLSMHVSCGPFHPEMAGLTLESVDDLFRRDGEPAGSRKFGLQWSIVEKAAAAVERVKRDRASGIEGAVQSGVMREKKKSVESTVKAKG